MNVRKFPKPRNLWFERLMALLASVNLALVLFNLSYISGRNFYFRNFPALTELYDPVKGIEPHRETVNYLRAVNALEEQVNQTGLQSPQAQVRLEELRRLSTEMIENNPFAGVEKSGTLEKIKNRMRDRVDVESSKQAFNTFWSQPYLANYGWDREIAFFDNTIRPLVASNYYRHIGENGEFVDNFWIIDLPFIILFAAELSARCWIIKRRHVGFTWMDAILWRWYDLFLLIPFWRWLRIIPVIVRLDQAHLLNLQPLRQQIHRGIVANFAEELTEIVVVRVINQIQGSIQRGELTSWLIQKDNIRPYIDINNVNEVEAITDILVQKTVYQVLPKIQPDIVAIIRHNIESVLKKSPIYQNLQNLPGVGEMPAQLSEQVANQIATGVYNTVVAAVEDPVGAKLSSQLLQHFSEALVAEVQKKNTIIQIQSLLLDFLEEVKLNYVQRLSQEDLEQVLEQTRQLRYKATVEPVVESSVLPTTTRE